MMGTLTTGSPVLGVLDWVKHNQSKTQARWLLAVMTPGYLLAKYGLIDFQAWAQKRMVETLIGPMMSRRRSLTRSPSGWWSTTCGPGAALM